MSKGKFTIAGKYRKRLDQQVRDEVTLIPAWKKQRYIADAAAKEKTQVEAVRFDNLKAKFQ